MEYLKVRTASRQARRLASAERRRLTWQEVQVVVEANVGRNPMPRLTARTGRDHAWYRGQQKGCPQHRIHFVSPDGLYPLAAVLHELAHHIHWCQDERVRVAMTTAERRRLWHGAEFTNILDSLLEDYYEG